MKHAVFTNAIECLNPIRKKFILIAAIGFLNMTAYAQCPFDNSFLFDATPPCPGTFNVGCMNGGEYVSINAVNGNTYTFTTCGGTTIDTELTLYDQFGFVPLAYNDDDCGVQSTITWVSTVTGPVNLLLDEFPCSNTGACIDVEITCNPPVQSGNGCNTDVTICTPGVAGPFGFNTPGPPVSSCLDFIGPDYAYIVLYITASGPLDLLIDGDAGTGFLDVAIFDVTTGDPCTEIQNVGNEISCNYADFANGCNQFGTTFPCTSSVPAPNVIAGDVLMIVVENWSGASTNFTLDLAAPPSAQTGPPDPTITPAGPFCDTDPPFQMQAVNMGGDWTGTGISLTGIFDPGSVAPGTYTIDYSIGQPPCQAQSQTTVTVNNCSTPCNLDNFNVNINSCQAGSLYTMSGTIQYTNPPAGGTLIVEVDNGTAIFDTIINPPFTSPDNFSISGIPADGSASTITVYFSADPACTQTINYTATAPCGCTAEIGTFTANITGSSTNNYVLCFGDQIDINTNNDWVEPGEMFAPPGPPYDPGVSWLIYSCPPTVALVPNLATDVPDDPCFLGLVSDFNLSDLNDLSMINSFPAGTFTDNIIYYVPITMYSMATGTYSYVNTAMPCYELGAPYAVQYLPNFTFNAVQDCNTSTATVTLNGGLPEIDGSDFTASSLLPVTASFANTTCTDGGTITINGLNGGEMWSFTVTDGNGCPYTVNGGPFPLSQNPGFNYPANAYCVTSGPVNPVITGVAGGTFASVPAGLTINAATGQITPATSTAGSYSITYTTPGPCPDNSTVVVDIVTAPVANAGPDVSICPGTSVTLAGSGPGTPSWAPGGTLSATNILNPVATPAGTTVYTLTLDVGGCTGTDNVTVTVLNPAPIVVSPDIIICTGDCTTLTVAGGDYFEWAPSPDIADSSLTTQNVCPVVTTIYDVTSYTIGSNMIANGDFSAGNTGFSSSYNFTNPFNGTEGEYNVIPNPQTYNGAFSPCGDNTTGAGNMMVVNGSGTVGATVWCQTLPVTANTDYLFSAWLTSVYPTFPAELQFTINGVPIGSNLNATATTCAWDEFFATWNSGAATSANICITNINTSVAGNDFALDDISFSPVCTQTASVTVTVANPDDPSFNYPLGSTYCQTSPDAVANVTGLAGGTFSYVVTSGGPFLDLDPVTGTVANGTSDLGTYDITYNTAGAPGSTCPQSSTVTLTITGAPVADFTFGTYCANDPDPLPTYINGGSAGVFSAAPAGLSFNTGTGLVDLSASTPGTYTVTNTINIPGCALAVFDDDIVINGLPAANITGTTTICPGAPLPDITINITAGAAPWNLTYNFNGAPVNVAVAATPFIISGAAIGSYDLVSVTDANGCTSPIAGNATISTYPVPVMNTLVDQDICEDGNLVVQNFGANIPGSTFAWTNVTGTDIGFGLSGNGPIAPFIATNGTGADITATVSVTPTSPNGCVGLPSTFDITIHPNPIVSFTGGPLQGCAPLVVTFDNTSTPAGANCTWTFGDGNTALGCGQVTNTYSAGIFSVSLTVTTADGCTGSASIANYVTVTENPVAEFTFSPQIIDVDMTVVDFANNSEFADAYTWNFGDESPTVNTINPSYTYPQVPGEYLVTLIATNSGGVCADTMQQLIIIQDVILFYVPNVFTPDHDEFNEGFHPVFTSGFDPFDYHLMIFNRWGEVVFESYDAEKGWDGTYSDQGLVQDGVYVWQIEFKETMSDKRHTHRGHVTVLK
jgi:gliding motility-associated-like protein